MYLCKLSFLFHEHCNDEMWFWKTIGIFDEHCKTFIQFTSDMADQQSMSALRIMSIQINLYASLGILLKLWDLDRHVDDSRRAWTNETVRKSLFSERLNKSLQRANDFKSRKSSMFWYRSFSNLSFGKAVVILKG